MYAYVITDAWQDDFSEHVAYCAVIADMAERSVTYTKEFPTVTQLRAAVWFNIGPVEWVGPQTFASIEDTLFPDMR